MKMKKIKDEEWFEKNLIHLHIPEGAVKKDGPSAGITMATALLSLITGTTIKSNLAMTGELSLTGQVLPIGGLREKTVAARRNGIKTILIPKANVRDLENIPKHVKAGVTFIPVTRADDVILNAFQSNILSKQKRPKTSAKPEILSQEKKSSKLGGSLKKKITKPASKSNSKNKARVKKQ